MATLGIEISASTRNVRRLLIRPREFFIAAAKLALSLFAGSPVDAAVALPDIASSLDIKSSPEKRVVALLERTLQRVFSNLLKEKFKSDETLANSAYAASFVGLSEHLTIEIEDDFFRHPENSAVIEAILPDAKRWFTAIGVSPTDMLNMMQRIKLVFARCLHDEWRANPIYYAEIISAIDSPFLDAAKLEDQWARYRTYLRSLVDEQVFDEMNRPGFPGGSLV